MLNILMVFFTSFSSAAPISPETKAELRSLAASIQTWASLCKGPDETEYSLGGGVGCDQGDMALFSGIACLTGDSSRCRDVIRAQGPDGRFWRAPRHVGHEGRDTFSRDQSLGVIATLLKTRDRVRARNWLRWIASPDGGNESLCRESDGRCELSLSIWRLMGDVWSEIGLEIPEDFERVMTVPSFVVDGITRIEAQSNPPGYQRHLVAVKLHIWKELGRWNDWMQETAEGMSDREPENAYFRWVAYGASERAAQTVLARCPRNEPIGVGVFPYGWIWEHDSNNSRNDSDGHDCLSMIRLLLRPEVLPPGPIVPMN